MKNLLNSPFWSKITGLSIVIVSIAVIMYQAISKSSVFEYDTVVFEFMMNIGLLFIVFSVEKNEETLIKEIRKKSLQSAFIIMQVVLLAGGFAYAYKSITLPYTTLFFVSEIGLLVYLFLFYGELYLKQSDRNNKAEYLIFMALSTFILIALFIRDFTL